MVVSGLPRSGTSLAMKMLAAGGMSTVTDGVRGADEDNPGGYFEDERVKELASGAATNWLADTRGKAIKIVSSLLQFLPPAYSYKVIFMDRDLDEVLASQAKMLARRGEATEVSDERLRTLYAQHLDKVLFQLRFRRCFEHVVLPYSTVLADAPGCAERIAAFVDLKLDVPAMAAVVDRRLYRNRSAVSTLAEPRGVE